MGARFKAVALLLACATTVSVAIVGLQTAASAEMHPLGVSVQAKS